MSDGEVDKFDALILRLRMLARINVERKIRMKEDVDLIVQFRFEMLLLKSQMDTMLIMLGEKGMISKDEFAKRQFDYMTQLVETLQTALRVTVLNDGSVIRGLRG